MATLGHGKVCHIALPAADVERSAAFYEDVFGWRIRRGEGRTTFDDGVGEVSGHFVPGAAPGAGGLIVYLWVDDLGRAIARLQDAGGTLVAGPGVDPGERTALFRDPGGTVLGVYQEPGGDGA